MSDVARNQTNVNGRTPLHLAANAGHVLVCDYIICIIDDKSPADEEGMTPFHLAAKSGHVGVCELFLGNIRDKHPKNKHGMAPLHLAVLEGHLNVCQLIVDKVEDKNPKSKFKIKFLIGLFWKILDYFGSVCVYEKESDESSVMNL